MLLEGSLREGIGEGTLRGCFLGAMSGRECFERVLGKGALRGRGHYGRVL